MQYESVSIASLPGDKKEEMREKAGDLTRKFDEFIDYLDGELPHDAFFFNGEMVAASFIVDRGDSYQPEIVVDPAHQGNKLGTFLAAGVFPNPIDPERKAEVDIINPDSLFFAYKQGFRVVADHGDGATAVGPVDKSSGEFVPVFHRDPGALQEALRNIVSTTTQFNNASRALKVWVDNLPYAPGDNAPLPFNHASMEDVLLSLPLDNYERTFLWTQMNICSDTPTPAPGPHISNISRQQVDNGYKPPAPDSPQARPDPDPESERALSAAGPRR
jgi:hypothetical protein